MCRRDKGNWLSPGCTLELIKCGASWSQLNKDASQLVASALHCICLCRWLHFSIGLVFYCCVESILIFGVFVILLFVWFYDNTTQSQGYTAIDFWMVACGGLEYFYLFLLDAGAGIFLSWPPAAPLDEIQGSAHLRLTICFQSIEVTLTDIFHSNVSLQLGTLTGCDSLLICT